MPFSEEQLDIWLRLYFDNLQGYYGLNAKQILHNK